MCLISQLSTDEQLALVRLIALTVLPRQQARAVLFTLCDLNATQVARMMGTSKENVSVLLSRAIGRIREIIQDLSELAA